jgi:hypothetical protein
MTCGAGNCCVSITWLLGLGCIWYAIISLGTLRDALTETQLTLHTTLIMAQQRHKIHPSVCCDNSTTVDHGICNMIDVSNGILRRFPGDKVAYKLVNFMSFLYGFTIIDY